MAHTPNKHKQETRKRKTQTTNNSNNRNRAIKHTTKPTERAPGPTNKTTTETTRNNPTPDQQQNTLDIYKHEEHAASNPADLLHRTTTDNDEDERDDIQAARDRQKQHAPRTPINETDK